MLKWKTKFTLISLNSKQTNLYSRVSPHFLKWFFGNLAVSLPYSAFCLRSPDNLLQCDEIVPLANYSLCLLFTPGKNWDLGVDVYSKKPGSQNWLPPIQKHQCLQEKIQTTLCGKGGGFKNTSAASTYPLSISSQPCLALAPSAPGIHPEISKPSSVLRTGSFLCLECRRSSLIPHSVLYLAHSSHPQAESVSPLFVLPFLTSLKPLDTLDIAVTTRVSVSPTKLRADYKQMPHLTHVEILGGENNT